MKIEKHSRQIQKAVFHQRHFHSDAIDRAVQRIQNSLVFYTSSLFRKLSTQRNIMHYSKLSLANGSILCTLVIKNFFTGSHTEINHFDKLIEIIIDRGCAEHEDICSSKVSTYAHEGFLRKDSVLTVKYFLCFRSQTTQCSIQETPRTLQNLPGA